MLTQALVLIASLATLAVGAELLVRGATSLARRTRIPPLFIGMTIVGFGTSTPELCTSLLAASRGLDGIAVGNVVGSNTFNLAIILGLTALLRPIAVSLKAIRVETWMVIAVAVVPFVALLTGGVLGRVTGALMVLALLVYLRRSYLAGMAAGPETTALPAPGPPGRVAVSSVAMVLGLVALAGGSHFLVESASHFAGGLGMSDLAIGVTIVAAGTSTPELFTSIAAALRGETDVAVGSVFGSNIFNVLGILGITCLVDPQTVPTQTVALDAPVLILASLAMLPILSSHGRVSRLEGAALCLGYAAYVVVLLTLAPGWFAG